MKHPIIQKGRGPIALVMALILSLSLSAGALAADTASGTDLRLTAIEGTVTLKNLSGKALSVREDMKLYSGYTLTTAAKSYAYVTLDSTKVVKLDAGTTVQVRKQGTKLELLVSAGQLFFNVTAPLSASESLNIRTSTMVTGIRGTSGYVSVNDENSSSVSVTDGTVVVHSTGTGESQSMEVHAGQTGSATTEDGGLQMSVGDLSGEDIPGFVAEEFQNDPDLQQRVGDATGLPVDDIAAGAQQRLEADEQQAQAAQDTIDQAAAQLPNQSAQAPAFQEPEPDRDPTPSRPEEPDEPDTPEEPDEPGGDEPGGEEPGGEEPGGEEPGGEEPGGEEPGGEEPGGEEPGGEEPGEPAVTDYTITGSATGADLQGYLDQYVTVTVASGGEVTIAAGESVTIPAGKSLTLGFGGSLTNDGTLTNNGTLTDNGGIRNDGTIHNAGQFNVDAYSNNYGSIDNTSTITITGHLQSASDTTITNSGTIALESGTLSNDGNLTNSGSLTISGVYARLSNSGTLTVESGGSITNNAQDDGYNTSGINNFGTLLVSGTITNNGWLSNGNGDAASTFGTITIQSGGKITNSGDIRNYACSASGKYNTIDIQTGGTLTNTASITNCGRITVSGTLTNNGTYSDRVVNGGTTYDGTVTNKEGGTISGNNAAQITSSSGYTDETTPTEP